MLTKVTSYCGTHVHAIILMHMIVHIWKQMPWSNGTCFHDITWECPITHGRPGMDLHVITCWIECKQYNVRATGYSLPACMRSSMPTDINNILFEVQYYTLGYNRCIVQFTCMTVWRLFSTPCMLTGCSMTTTWPPSPLASSPSKQSSQLCKFS